MGCSGRPTDFDHEKATPEKVNQYFTEYLERWRVRMTHNITRLYNPKEYYAALKQDNLAREAFTQGRLDSHVSLLDSIEKLPLTEFVIAGHSMGGYIAGNYAIKYQKHVKKLILLSPIGVIPASYAAKSEIGSRLSTVLGQREIQNFQGQ